MQAKNRSNGWESWCRGVANQVPLPKAHEPIARDIEIVTTFLDAAIDNSLVNSAAEEAVNQLGSDRIGFCYLKGELTHNFLNELSSTTKRDFWWHGELTSHAINFLLNGTKFPLQSEISAEDPDQEWSFTHIPKNLLFDVPKTVLFDIPWKLLKGVSSTIAPPHDRCELLPSMWA